MCFAIAAYVTDVGVSVVSVEDDIGLVEAMKMIDHAKVVADAQPIVIRKFDDAYIPGNHDVLALVPVPETDVKSERMERNYRAGIFNEEGKTANAFDNCRSGKPTIRFLTKLS